MNIDFQRQENTMHGNIRSFILCLALNISSTLDLSVSFLPLTFFISSDLATSEFRVIHLGSANLQVWFLATLPISFYCLSTLNLQHVASRFIGSSLKSFSSF
jgi:hypothetical protein